MFFTLKELVRWFGMTVFEIWIHLVSILIFSVLAVLKHENIMTSTTWWIVFLPLFIADGLNAYFCMIVFIRQYKEEDLRQAGLRFFFSVLSFSLLFTFKFLMCQKLSYSASLTHTEVIAPVFPLLVILSIRSCQAQSH